MSKFDLENMGNEEKESGSDFFRIPEGDTRLRILTEFEKVEQVWEGEFPNAKLVGFKEDGAIIGANQKVRTSGWSWCLINGELKIVTFPRSLVAKIANLKRSEDYAFDDWPMPYDITIHNTGEGGDRYSITPARKNEPVSEDILVDLEAVKPIPDIIKAIQDKRSGGGDIEYPESNESNNANAF